MHEIDLSSSILITGGNGLVGTALTRYLRGLGYRCVIPLGRKDCDLLNQEQTKQLFIELCPKYVFHLAATVYGIMGNLKNHGLSFFENSLINLNVIEASHLVKVKKIVAMGTCAGYPLASPAAKLQESEFLNGEPHESEYGYAQAKRAMLAQLISYHTSYQLSFAYVISSNLYGLNDKFDTEFGHVIPSLIRKFFEAKQSGKPLSIWGNGTPKRDFLFAEDAADALFHILCYIEGPVNMASGEFFSIKEVVEVLTDYLKMQNKVIWDSSKPDGRVFKELDISKLKTVGFKPKTPLSEGLKQTYQWFAENAEKARK